MFITLRKNRSGDTIVEVIIAMAIIALVVVTAYSVTSLNVVRVQDNIEHIEAQHLVESQIEALRANDGLPTGSTCFKQDGTPATGTDCVQTVASSAADYSLNITEAAQVYAVEVRWDALGSSAEGKITMYYRMKL